MDPTIDELWVILFGHCACCCRWCEDAPPGSKDAKMIYERLERALEVAKVILSKG